jgi:hypothetical protein
MVLADRASETRATNRPAPEGPVPPLIGLVNAPVQWGGERWAAYVWQFLPDIDRQSRDRLLIHELFHRVQPQLGMYLIQPSNDHLDQLQGRYWLRLEWRALAAALAAEDAEQLVAISDALGFRAERRRRYPDMVEREHADEIREGLAQYTGTVVAAGSAEEASADAIRQLQSAEQQPTYVRTFGYPSGTAYGLLLDRFASGWTRGFAPTSDLGALLASSSGAEATRDVEQAATRYGGPQLLVEETVRDSTQRAHVAALRRPVVEWPRVNVTRARGAQLVTTRRVPNTDVGTG